MHFIVGALVAGAVAFGVYYFSGAADKADADLSISVSEEGIDIDGK